MRTAPATVYRSRCRRIVSCSPRPRRRSPRSTRAPRRSSTAQPGSTCARPTSGRRATCPARSTCRADTSRAGSKASSPTRRSRSSSTAPRPTARRSRRRRSAELGYTDVHSLAGGFTDWKRNGLEIVMPRTLSPEKRTRYSRHLLIPEIGEEGQLKLLDSRILLIGAGGLGSPASLYLAAAGIGTLGIVDADIVDETNLQRQIAHSLETLGTPKVDSAKRAIKALNPDVERRHLSRAAHLGEHRPHPRRRLGPDRRRRRQLPDALPRQRRVGVARDPRRPRLDLPLRRSGDGLQASRGAVLPLPLPGAAAARARAVVRRGRRARRAARASSARCRRTRRSSSPQGSASRSSAACSSSTRSRPSSTRCASSVAPTARSAATTRRSPSTSTTSSSARDESCQGSTGV